MTLSQKKLFLLDMDGTIYLGDRLFDGTLDFLHAVKARGGRYVFLTNNSSRGIDRYLEKLQAMGIAAQPDEFFTSADATIRYLKAAYPSGMVYYVCGTESLKRQLRAAGLKIAERPDDTVGAVLLGYDTELTYQKLEDCCILLMRGAD